jgi:hypothetical protein
VTEHIRLGAIVRLPDNVAFGKYAIVTKIDRSFVTCNNGTYDFLYDLDQLEYYGTIARGRTYGTLSGNRFAVCTLTKANGITREAHVKTRDGRDGSEETRALEVRKLAFVELTKEGR